MSYEIKKLLPRHYKVMDLMLLGKKQKEIAEELCLSEQAVSSIVNSRVFKEAIPRRKIEIQEEPVTDALSVGEMLRESIVRSAERLCEMLDSEDERVVLRAAMDILDRAGYPKAAGVYRSERAVLVMDDLDVTRIEQALFEIGE